MSNSSKDKITPRVITRDSAGEYTAWSPPDMDLAPSSDITNSSIQHNKLLTPSKLEEIQQQAYQEAYTAGLKQGKEEGYASGKDAVNKNIERWRRLLDLLDQPLQEMDSQVEEQLVALSITIAKHLIRRELKTDPGQIVAVVREAVNALPLASRHVRIHLHPDDAELIAEALRLTEHESTWRVEEDPMLTRGGCRIMSEDSQIDATVEARLSAIIAKVLGDERGQDAE